MKAPIQLSDHFSYGRLIRFTLPSIGMMIFTSIYGVVDGFFVSNFAGKTPFAAVNLIMPVLMIMATVGFMFGTGGSAIVAKTFGEGDPEKANNHFSLFVYVSLILGIILAVLAIIFIRPIAVLLGAEGQLLEDAVLYARIILLALPFNILQFLFQSFMVTAEKPQLGLLTTVFAGVTNMVLDAVLVISLPQEYKLAGAATATAASQTMGGVIPLIYFARKNSSILRLGKTKFDGKALLKACTNGSSEFMSNIAMSLVGMLYNIQLLKYAGENGVAAYGVMMYVSMIFSGAFIGYSIGTAPIFGFLFHTDLLADHIDQFVIGMVCAVVIVDGGGFPQLVVMGSGCFGKSLQAGHGIPLHLSGQFQLDAIQKILALRGIVLLSQPKQIFHTNHLHIRKLIIQAVSAYKFLGKSRQLRLIVMQKGRKSVGIIGFKVILPGWKPGRWICDAEHIVGPVIPVPVIRRISKFVHRLSFCFSGGLPSSRSAAA